MDWKRYRFSKWVCGPFMITETIEEQGQYRLDAADSPPAFFETLEKAKAQANVLNELLVVRADNERLRTELARLRDEGTWEPHPRPEDFEQPLDSWPDEGPADSSGSDETLLDRGGDGRGAPRRQIGTPDNPEADAIAKELLVVMSRDGR
jgi:hypothetical protein